MSKLCNLIRLYKEGNKDYLIDIINIFNPVLQKFQRESYCEDIENDLILFMIMLLDKMPIENEFFKEDKYAFSYIYKSLRNKYIYLNKKGYALYCNEINNDEVLNYNGYEDIFNDVIFNDMIRELSIAEQNIINKKNIYNLSEADIARELNISRQAVHKTHKRVLNKLKNIYNI